MPPETERLPCRGCTRSCANYAYCDGKPWVIRDQPGGAPPPEASEAEAGG